MNSYFFKMTNEEKENILDQHKEIYDGYVTSYAQQPKEQPLYTQSYANDKQGITVNNKGVVTAYKNMGINEMRFDNKSTGLFADEENGFKDSEDKDDDYYVSLGEQLDMIGDGDDDLEHGTFGNEDDNRYPERMVNHMDTNRTVGVFKKGIGFNPTTHGEELGFEFHPTDIPHGTRFGGTEIGDFDYDDDDFNTTMSGRLYDNNDQDDELIFNKDSEIFNDVDDEDAEGLFDDLAESLKMFKRFTKYN